MTTLQKQARFSDEHQARKRFGQNFLHDQHVIGRIVSSVNAKPDDTVVEIGPGLGALTEPLLHSAQHLTVVELDRDLASALPRRLNYPTNLTIIEADALRFDFKSLIKKDNQKLRVVGNLPYNISTPLLFHLLSTSNIVQDMHFMLQKEVVDRIVAPPNSKTYGRLSVMLQYYCKPTFLFEVPPSSFTPAPKVTSAVFRLEPFVSKPLLAMNEKAFAQLVAHVFTMRRKTLRSSLKGQIDDAGFAQAGIDPMARPETLSVAQFVALSNTISTVTIQRGFN